MDASVPYILGILGLMQGAVLFIVNDLRSRLAHLERQHMDFGRKGESS